MIESAQVVIFFSGYCKVDRLLILSFLLARWEFPSSPPRFDGNAVTMRLPESGGSYPGEGTGAAPLEARPRKKSAEGGDASATRKRKRHSSSGAEEVPLAEVGEQTCGTGNATGIDDAAAEADLDATEKYSFDFHYRDSVPITRSTTGSVAWFRKVRHEPRSGKGILADDDDVVEAIQLMARSSVRVSFCPFITFDPSW